MKKMLLFLLFATAFSHFAFAQSSQISCIAYKQIYRHDGTWGKWPTIWSSYKEEGRSNPIVRTTTVEELSSGNLYRVQLLVDGLVKTDFYVVYDASKTATVRSDWNDKYVNCYKDKNGDYLYTQGVSLEALAKDSTIWSQNDDAQIYFMIFSENYAVAVR